MSDPGPACSWSAKAKSDDVGRLPIYDFLFVFSSNIWLNHLRSEVYTGLQNLSDFDFDLTRSQKVKIDDAVGLTI